MRWANIVTKDLHFWLERVYSSFFSGSNTGIFGAQRLDHCILPLYLTEIEATGFDR